MFYRVIRYCWRNEEDFIYWCPFNTKQEALDDFYADRDYDDNPFQAILLKVIEAPDFNGHLCKDDCFTEYFPETHHYNCGLIDYL